MTSDAHVVMLLAWLQATKPRSQSRGLTSPAKPTLLALGRLWLWLGVSEAKAKGLSRGIEDPLRIAFEVVVEGDRG
jgi:hypothetical protein